MSTKLVTAPTEEPITTTEAKLHLRIDSASFADDLSVVQSIAPGSHAIAASYSLKGSGIEVLAYSAMVILEAGTCGAGGTVDVKVQEANTDSDASYVDVSGGSFTQVTTANDNATYEYAYTGSKRYIRAVATVAVAACEFGVSVVRDAPTSAEDSLISNLITMAREYAEAFLARALVTQTWDLYLDEFPEDDVIYVPYPPLQSITSIKYVDTEGTEQTWAAANYIVDVASEPGRITPAYGIVWPSTRDIINAITVRFVTGYGAASAVPVAIKQGMLLHLGGLFQNREHVIAGAIADLPLGVKALYWAHRILDL